MVSVLVTGIDAGGLPDDLGCHHLFVNSWENLDAPQVAPARPLPHAVVAPLHSTGQLSAKDVVLTCSRSVSSTRLIMAWLSRLTLCQCLSSCAAGAQNVTIASIPSTLSPGLAPPGKALVHAYTAGNEPYELWEGLDRRSPEYQRLKARASPSA